MDFEGRCFEDRERASHPKWKLVLDEHWKLNTKKWSTQKWRIQNVIRDRYSRLGWEKQRTMHDECRFWVLYMKIKDRKQRATRSCLNIAVILSFRGRNNHALSHTRPKYLFRTVYILDCGLQQEKKRKHSLWSRDIRFAFGAETTVFETAGRQAHDPRNVYFKLSREDKPWSVREWFWETWIWTRYTS